MITRTWRNKPATVTHTRWYQPQQRFLATLEHKRAWCPTETPAITAAGAAVITIVRAEVTAVIRVKTTKHTSTYVEVFTSITGSCRSNSSSKSYSYNSRNNTNNSNDDNSSNTTGLQLEITATEKEAVVITVVITEITINISNYNN